MNKAPISVCMVSGAEAHRIRACLESVAGWVSEIVIVLNEEVADGTDKIAAEFGAKVFREPWKGFKAQKNSATDKATQPWILNLDADEVVGQTLAQEIKGVTEKGTSTATAYSFPRCTFYLGRWIRHGDWYPDHVVRLWKRGQARWTGVDPHAYLGVEGSTVRLKSDLLHHSNESINRHVLKIVPFSDEFVAQYDPAKPLPGPFELVARPAWRFVRAYFFRLGFLDGWAGYYIAWLTAFATLTRYLKVREARQFPR